jgi:CheY-like chemotaxis protein
MTHVTVEEVEILLVEDNPEDLELALRALRRHKIANRIRVARDGAEALAFLRHPGGHLPKVVLLDLKLPKISGIEVLEAIRADERTRVLPVVVLTSSRESPDVRRCYELGVNSYIVKPVDFDAFVKAVAEVGLYWMLLNQPPEPAA